MKVTISELRSMIREALEETTMETVGQEERKNAGSPEQNVLGGNPGEGAVTTEGAWGELEEAWDELEEAAGLQEAADKKEKKPAKKVKKEEKKEDKKPETKDKKAFSLSASQLKAVKKLDADDFEKCLQLMARGIPVQAALKMCHAKED